MVSKCILGHLVCLFLNFYTFVQRRPHGLLVFQWFLLDIGNVPRETLPFTLINPIIITYHGNRGTCFYRGCIPHTFPFRLSLLLTIRIKPLSLDNKHDHSACFLNRGCRSIFNLRFLSCTYACSSIFGNVTRMKWHNSSKGTSHSFEAWQICF